MTQDKKTTDGEDLYWALIEVFNAYLASGHSMRDLENELSETIPLYWSDKGLTYGKDHAPSPPEEGRK